MSSSGPQGGASLGRVPSSTAAEAVRPRSPRRSARTRCGPRGAPGGVRQKAPISPTSTRPALSTKGVRPRVRAPNNEWAGPLRSFRRLARSSEEKPIEADGRPDRKPEKCAGLSRPLALAPTSEPRSSRAERRQSVNQRPFAGSPGEEKTAGITARRSRLSPRGGRAVDAVGRACRGDRGGAPSEHRAAAAGWRGRLSPHSAGFSARARVPDRQLVGTPHARKSDPPLSTVSLRHGEARTEVGDGLARGRAAEGERHAGCFTQGRALGGPGPRRPSDATATGGALDEGRGPPGGGGGGGGATPAKQ